MKLRRKKKLYYVATVWAKTEYLKNEFSISQEHEAKHKKKKTMGGFATVVCETMYGLCMQTS